MHVRADTTWRIRGRRVLAAHEEMVHSRESLIAPARGPRAPRLPEGSAAPAATRASAQRGHDRSGTPRDTRTRDGIGTLRCTDSLGLLARNRAPHSTEDACG